MKLQTIEEVEHAIGGRPKKTVASERMTFYLSAPEAIQLRTRAEAADQSISQIIRALTKTYLSGK